MKPRVQFYCALTVALLVPIPALAQTADTFAELPQVLDIGRKVVVRDLTGRKTTGRVADVTPTSLTVAIEDAWGTIRKDVFRSDAIRSINRTDAIWNGLLIGLGVGIVAEELFVRHNCGPRGNDDECAAIVTAVGLVTFVPGGAVVGALIDKFTGNQLIYRAPKESALWLSPIVRPTGAGVSVALRF